MELLQDNWLNDLLIILQVLHAKWNTGVDDKGWTETWSICAAFLVVHGYVADAMTFRKVPCSPGEPEDNLRREEECDSEARGVPDTLQLLLLLDRQY